MPRTSQTQSNGSNDRATPQTIGSPVTEHVADKAHETIDHVAGRAAKTEEEVREAAEKVKARAKKSEQQALEAADKSLRTAESYIQQHPIFSAGFAVAAGFVLGSLLRR